LVQVAALHVENSVAHDLVTQPMHVAEFVSAQSSAQFLPRQES